MTDENNSPRSHDWPHDDRDQMYEERVHRKRGIRDPEDDPDSWDICRDFIDHLANELEMWHVPSETDEESLEGLTWFHVGCDGVGPDARVHAWDRARIELSAGFPMSFVRSLEDAVRQVSERARHAIVRYRKLCERDDPEMPPDVEIMNFEVSVVEPCLRFLRNFSRTVGRELAGTSSRAKTSELVEVSCSAEDQTGVRGKLPTVCDSEVNALLEAVEADITMKRVILLMGDRYDQEGVDPPTVERLLRDLKLRPTSGNSREKLAKLTELNAFEAGQGRQLTQTGREVYGILKGRDRSL